MCPPEKYVNQAGGAVADATFLEPVGMGAVPSAGKARVDVGDEPAVDGIGGVVPDGEGTEPPGRSGDTERGEIGVGHNRKPIFARCSAPAVTRDEQPRSNS
jgi:hypothetical protein